MKSLKKCLMAKFVMTALLFAPAAMARKGGGSEVGSGAGVRILPDDTVVLADPFIKRPGTKPTSFANFDEKIAAEIDRIGFLLVRLGAAVDEEIPFPLPPESEERKKLIEHTIRGFYASRTYAAKFITQSVKFPLLEYHLMDEGEFTEQCSNAYVPEDYKEPGSVPIACTIGPVTFIRKDLFGKMRVREQAKLIVHERLHSMASVPHYYIAELTEALEILLSKLNDQIAGKRPVLTAGEVEAIETVLSQRIWAMKLGEGRPAEDTHDFSNNWRIHPNGGGIVHKDSRVAPGAYVGVGSMIGPGSRIDEGAEVIASSCYAVACQVAKGAVLFDSAISPRPLGMYGPAGDLAGNAFAVNLSAGTRILGSSIIGEHRQGQLAVDLQDGASIILSSVTGLHSISLHPDAEIQSSSLAITARGAASPRLEMSKAASIRNTSSFIITQKHPGAKSEPALIVSERAALDFKNAGVCEIGSFVLLRSELVIDRGDVLSSLCRNRFDD